MRDEALAAIAERYFTGHGPATVADFAWWTGLSLGDARHALHLAKPRLEEDRVDGQSIWLPRDAAPPRPARAGTHLLPAYDELLVGYADRSAAVGGEHERLVSVRWGVLKPTVVVGGQVVGTWQRALTRRGVALSIAWFLDVGARKRQSIAKAFHPLCRVSGCESAPIARVKACCDALLRPPIIDDESP